MKLKRESTDKNCEEIKYPEEIRMEFVCRVLRFFKRSLKPENIGVSDEKWCGKDI